MTKRNRKAGANWVPSNEEDKPISGPKTVGADLGMDLPVIEKDYSD